MTRDFTYKSSGTNSQGNHYCSRDFGSDVPNSNCYHYSNLDGLYYYSNPDGSTYYNNGQGGSVYTSPSGMQCVSGFDSSGNSQRRGDCSQSSGTASGNTDTKAN